MDEEDFQGHRQINHGDNESLEEYLARVKRLLKRLLKIILLTKMSVTFRVFRLRQSSPNRKKSSVPIAGASLPVWPAWKNMSKIIILMDRRL